MEIKDEPCINECVFRDVLDTCSLNKKYGSKELSVAQNSTIQKYSMRRNDDLYQTVYSKSEERRYHNDCYWAYTSKEKISRYLKKRKLDLNTSALDSPSNKNLRR